MMIKRQRALVHPITEVKQAWVVVATAKLNPHSPAVLLANPLVARSHCRGTQLETG